VPRIWVVNASPLILLARIERLDLLTSLAETVRVPRSVLQELEAGAHRDAAADAVRNTPGLSIVPDPSVPEQVAAWDLGAGETHVIADALEVPDAEAVLDDLAARAPNTLSTYDFLRLSPHARLSSSEESSQ